MPTKNETDTVDYVVPVTGSGDPDPHVLSTGGRVEVAGLTHPGKVRPTNEDHFLAARFGRSMITLQTSLPPAQVPDRFEEMGYALVVADGVGGAAAGEVASSLAITVGVHLALNSPNWILLKNPQEVREHMERWSHRFRQIDSILAQRARANPELHGMATTMTLACTFGPQLVLYHVGDSRAYLFRQGRLYRLTQDHTMAQAMADAGMITPAEVAGNRLRHILTQVLGGGQADLQAEIQHVQLADGDRLLLCTDGLTGMVPDAGIAEILGRVVSSDEASRALVERALEAGGKDNVTVVLARFTFPEAPPFDVA